MDVESVDADVEVERSEGELEKIVLLGLAARELKGEDLRLEGETSRV